MRANLPDAPKILMMFQDLDESNLGHKELMAMTNNQNPAYREVMRDIIEGVQKNDLLEVCSNSVLSLNLQNAHS